MSKELRILIGWIRGVCALWLFLSVMFLCNSLFVHSGSGGEVFLLLSSAANLLLCVCVFFFCWVAERITALAEQLEQVRKLLAAQAQPCAHTGPPIPPLPPDPPDSSES